LGPAWVTEPLFLNYVFARFNLDARLHDIRYARGVRDVVHFGNRWPTIPEQAMVDLQAAVGPSQVQVVRAEFEPGDLVEVSGGPFDGLRAVVGRAIPARNRVALLLDFLGRQTCVEIDESQLVLAPKDRLVSRSRIALGYT
jgi:transcription antitermination factor NusG